MKKLRTSLFFVLAISVELLAQGLPKGAYVLNALGQNLSVINLQNGNVNLDALPLGALTNTIKIRGERAYVINSGTNEIQVIRLNPLATANHIDLGNNTNPWSLDLVNDSIAAVSLLFTDQVAIVNVNTGHVEQYIPVGTGPQGVKYHDGKIYIANSGFNGVGFDPGTVSVIDAATLTVVNSYNVGINPWELDVDSQEQLVVVCSGDYGSVTGEMDIINLNTGNAVNIMPFTSQLTSVAINSLDQCYIGTFGVGVMVYNLITQSFERNESNPLQGGPGIDFDQQDNVYITGFDDDSVRVFSPAHQKIASYLVGDGPASIAIYDPSITAIEPPLASHPQKFELFANYPNPFNPTTVISWRLSIDSDVELSIFDILGQPIRNLVNGKQTAGKHQVVWDGKDEHGKVLPSGIYFYRLQAGDFSEIHKMQLIR